MTAFSIQYCHMATASMTSRMSASLAPEGQLTVDSAAERDRSKLPTFVHDCRCSEEEVFVAGIAMASDTMCRKRRTPQRLQNSPQGTARAWHGGTHPRPRRTTRGTNLGPGPALSGRGPANTRAVNLGT